MDFFQRQVVARRNTLVLEFYFGLAVIGIVLAIYCGVAVVVGIERNDRTLEQAQFLSWDPKLFGIVSLTTIFVIAAASFYRIAELSRGGSAVAEMLGARPVSATPRSLDEQKLRNVVEEMAIASGTPVPQLYILPGDEVINAFAAGHNTGDMAICVTGGALKYLTRDELQGVIGHEFSHILNGDMKLNLRLMGLVFGILCLATIGDLLLRTRGEKNPLPLFGIVLIAIGSIGVFFARLIKSAVSREREFLADAASVQFTRNPGGLANALKKVGDTGSRIDEPNADEVSHFFFANGLAESSIDWMSTHPPIEERIRRIDPSWDGQFIQVYRVRPDVSPEADSTPSKKSAIAGMGGLAGAAILATTVMPQVGKLTGRQLDCAAGLMANIPPDLAAAAHETMSAVALVYTLLLGSEQPTPEMAQRNFQPGPAILAEMQLQFPLVHALDPRARLPLVTLSLTALRGLSAAQYAAFNANVQALVALHGQVDLFAYVLQKMILRRLDPVFNPSPVRPAQIYGIKPLLPDCSILLSAIACAGQSDPDVAQTAFDLGAQKLDDPNGILRFDATAYDLGQIDAALNRLVRASPPVKKTIINACAEAVAADGVIQQTEAELLRAIADTLDCPIPPFLGV